MVKFTNLADYFKYSEEVLIETELTKQTRAFTHIYLQSVKFNALKSEYRKCINGQMKIQIVKHARVLHVNSFFFGEKEKKSFI